MNKNAQELLVVPAKANVTQANRAKARRAGKVAEKTGKTADAYQAKAKQKAAEMEHGFTVARATGLADRLMLLDAEKHQTSFDYRDLFDTYGNVSSMVQLLSDGNLWPTWTTSGGKVKPICLTDCLEVVTGKEKRKTVLEKSGDSGQSFDEKYGLIVPAMRTAREMFSRFGKEVKAAKNEKDQAALEMAAENGDAKAIDQIAEQLAKKQIGQIRSAIGSVVSVATDCNLTDEQKQAIYTENRLAVESAIAFLSGLSGGPSVEITERAAAELAEVEAIEKRAKQRKVVKK